MHLLPSAERGRALPQRGKAYPGLRMRIEAKEHEKDSAAIRGRRGRKPFGHLLQLHAPKSVTNTIPPLNGAVPAQRASPT
jgi:hypothetical protein